jgi:hypothetical protein
MADMIAFLVWEIIVVVVNRLHDYGNGPASQQAS